MCSGGDGKTSQCGPRNHTRSKPVLIDSGGVARTLYSASESGMPAVLAHNNRHDDASTFRGVKAMCHLDWQARTRGGGWRSLPMDRTQWVPIHIGVEHLGADGSRPTYVEGEHSAVAGSHPIHVGKHLPAGGYHRRCLCDAATRHVDAARPERFAALWTRSLLLGCRLSWQQLLRLPSGQISVLCGEFSMLRMFGNA